MSEISSFADYNILNEINDSNLIDPQDHVEPKDKGITTKISIDGVVESAESEKPNSKSDLKSLSTADLMLLKEKRLREEANSEGEYRREMIYNEALRFGIASGAYYKAYMYKDFFGKSNIETELDKIFNFEYLTLENGRIQPPIIGHTKDHYDIESQTQAREIKKTYFIKEQAKVISSPKNWRIYLDPVLNLKKPALPHRSLIPRTSLEKKQWDKGINDGWEIGERMTEDNIVNQIKKLTADYMGMIAFHTTLQNNMIDNLISSEMPVAIATDKEGMRLNIGEKILKINRLPKFNENEAEWVAIPQIFDLVRGD